MLRSIRELAKFLMAGLLVVGSCLGISFWAWGPPMRDDLPVTLHEGGLYDEWQQIESADPNRLYFEVTLYHSELFTKVHAEPLSQPSLDLRLDPLDSTRIRPFAPFVVRGSVARAALVAGDSVEIRLHGMQGQASRTINLDRQFYADGTTITLP